MLRSSLKKSFYVTDYYSKSTSTPHNTIETRELFSCAVVWVLVLNMYSQKPQSIVCVVVNFCVWKPDWGVN